MGRLYGCWEEEKMKLEFDNNAWVDVETNDYKTFYLTATGKNGNEIVINNITKKYLFQLHKEIGIMLRKK